jgi:hypothetical protein
VLYTVDGRNERAVLTDKDDELILSKAPSDFTINRIKQA